MSFRGKRRNFSDSYKSSGSFPRSRNRDFRSFNKQDNNRQFFSNECFTEKDLGITEYLSSHEGFSGIIKARYSDFHVNEINKSGEIAKLTDLKIPEDFKLSAAESSNVEDTVLSTEIWDKLKELAVDEEKLFEIDAEAFSKEQRTQIHHAIRDRFGSKVVAHTNVVNDKKIMCFKKNTNPASADNRFQWPKDKGEFVHFLVYKEAIDTMEAAFKISDCLRMKASSFTYAGVKDKRAKTTQWFCVKKVDPRKLINCTKRLRNVHVGNITFKEEPLKLGHLSGNRFRIALRNVIADDAVINTALESLKTNGFINYYGLQRFGSDKEVPTFKIGVALLKGSWKEACDLILNPKKSEDPSSEIAQAKRVYKETSNSEMASKKFSRWYNKCIESKLLLGFVRNHENDYVNALENIPRNVRLLYLHSFQSLVWNTVLSRRIKEFGLKPIVGDLVLLSDSQLSLPELDEIIMEVDDETETEEPSKLKQEVKILTEDDLSTYTIYDVVLPLPGYDVVYPDNQIKDWYKEVLEKHGLTLEFPKQKVRTYNISGAYRKIITQVKDLTWKISRYNHPNDVLIRSDYEELIGEGVPEDYPDGQYKCLCLDFCLDSSCYATMVLREILKMDTSVTTQTKLNTYHVEHKKPSNTEDVESFPGNDSLLSNPAKYEEFKQKIFATSSDNLKHELVENTEEENCPLTKKQKTDD